MESNNRKCFKRMINIIIIKFFWNKWYITLKKIFCFRKIRLLKSKKIKLDSFYKIKKLNCLLKNQQFSFFVI